MVTGKTVINELKVLEKRNVRKGSSNGAIVAQEVFKFGDAKYRINIKTESHDDQSYAKLYRWTDDNGFSLVINKNPKADYGENPSYQNDLNKVKPVFDRMFNDLTELAKSFT